MNLLWMFLLISFSFANAPGCPELGKIVTYYEQELQWKGIGLEDQQGKVSKTCNNKALETLIVTHQFKAPEKEVLSQYGCQQLAGIEATIAKLENEQSLLAGFKKLKADIAANKKQTASPDVKVARRSGLNFLNGLNTAKSLEVLLETGDLIKQIKSYKPQDRDNLTKFTQKLKEACADNKNGACDPQLFSPNQASIEAINELIDNSDLGDDLLIKNWKAELAIKKKATNEQYSFMQMEADLKNAAKKIEEGKLELTREELRAIQSLPDFENNDKLSLASMKKDIKVQELMQGYKFHVEDLKKRQHFEVQSKVSLIWQDFGDKIQDPLKTTCDQAMASHEQAMTCLSGLKKYAKENKDPRRSSIDQKLNLVFESVSVISNYLSDLEDSHTKCLSLQISEEMKKSGELPKECIDSFGDINYREAALSTELRVLYAIKDKIAAQNPKLIQIRNFALDKFKSMNCGASETSSLEFQCADPAAKVSIPQNVDALYNSVLLIVKPDRGEEKLEIDKLCAEENFKFKEKLCAFGKETPDQKVIPPDPHKDEGYEASTEVPGGASDPERDAMVQNLAYLANDIAATWARGQQSYQPPFNPYNYNYTPYMGPPMMGISDQILFNAQFYGGYGYYMPTMGHQPYTAFPSSGFNYAPFTSSKSAYFTPR